LKDPSPPEIVNIVATGDLKQAVSLVDVSKLPYTIYDQEIYGGRAAYLKAPNMYGKVTIFPSGKLISIGTKSLTQAQHDLKQTVHTLSQAGLVKPVSVEPRIRNIVAVMQLSNIASLEEIAQTIEVIYEPEQFPGVILKLENIKATYLIFQSGKIVITGATSPKQLQEAAETITNTINSIQ